MKYAGSLAGLIALLGSLIGCTVDRDRVLYRRYAGYNYCHMKVETTADPARPGERDIIDFYGPCDAYD